MPPVPNAGGTPPGRPCGRCGASTLALPGRKETGAATLTARLARCCCASICATRFRSKALLRDRHVRTCVLRRPDGQTGLTDLRSRPALFVRSHSPSVSRGLMAQVLNATGQIADHPEEQIHCRGLDVPPRFPPGHGVRTEPKQVRQLGLREIESFTDCTDLVR